jgi:phosphopantothenoylcysteine decarboxylase/phosphopantothenate--cysteine ligase
VKLKDKNILLCVTGGISAYKSPGICSRLRKLGANVKVVMTKSATKFITPLTFQTMSDNLVNVEMFTKVSTDPGVKHIELAKWADIIVVAPATANTIAKFANGIADNLLTNIYLARRSPVIIVPAMNTFMLNSITNRENLKKLKDRGDIVLGTHTDILACKDLGDGKMLEPDEIVDAIDTVLRKKDFENKTVIVTAGPTIEKIDPVRYITNHSSGKMGYALAEEAKKRGAKVILISGPVSIKAPEVDKFIKIESTEDMFSAVKDNFETADIIIKAAAPADFKPEKYADEKIKKEENSELKIHLTSNPDIAKYLGERKGSKKLIGFAAESQNEIENGKKKLKNKNFDMIVINNIKGEHTAFKSDTNEVTIVDRCENVEKLPRMSKSELAEKIFDKIKTL